MRVVTIVNEYLKDHKFLIKERTYIFYQQMTSSHIEKHFGEFEATSDNIHLISEKFLELQKTKQYSNSTLKSVRSLINRALLFAKKKQIIDEHLQIEVNLKSDTFKNVDSLNNEDVYKLEKYIRSRNRAYSYGILISLYTGVRIGELLSLRWSDIDFKRKIITIRETSCKMCVNHKLKRITNTPKSISSMRQIPITQNVNELLKKLKEYQKGKSEYIISRQTGKQVEVRSYQESFSRLLKKLNIRHYGFHSLRHTFATRCYHLGMDIKTLSELLGHSCPSITLKKYVHSNINIKRSQLDNIDKKMEKNT